MCGGAGHQLGESKNNSDPPTRKASNPGRNLTRSRPPERPSNRLRHLAKNGPDRQRRLYLSPRGGESQGSFLCPGRLVVRCPFYVSAYSHAARVGAIIILRTRPHIRPLSWESDDVSTIDTCVDAAAFGAAARGRSSGAARRGLRGARCLPRTAQPGPLRVIRSCGETSPGTLPDRRDRRGSARLGRRSRWGTRPVA